MVFNLLLTLINEEEFFNEMATLSISHAFSPLQLFSQQNLNQTK